MTKENYVISVAECFGEQGEVTAVAEGLKHIQVSLRDVGHLPDNDVTPFSFAQR